MQPPPGQFQRPGAPRCAPAHPAVPPSTLPRPCPRPARRPTDLDDTLVLTKHIDAQAYVRVCELGRRLLPGLDEAQLVADWRRLFAAQPWDPEHKARGAGLEYVCAACARRALPPAKPPSTQQAHPGARAATTGARRPLPPAAPPGGGPWAQQGNRELPQVSLL